MSKLHEAEKQGVIERLRDLCPPGTEVKCLLRHVSRSGMLRVISFKVVQGADLIDITYNVGLACDYRVDRDKWGLRVSGCGMDMGFAVVYDLARTLYPDGFTCTGERCPSSDHNNGDRDRTPHLHRDGGYALRSTWI